MRMKDFFQIMNEEHNVVQLFADGEMIAKIFYNGDISSAFNSFDEMEIKEIDFNDTFPEWIIHLK